MQYNSWLYLIPFLGCSVLTYYLTPIRHRWIPLLISSILFYLLGASWLLLFVLFSTMTIYLATLKIDHGKDQFKEMKKTLDKTQRKEEKARMQKKEKGILALVCLINLGILFFCKYYNFLGGSLNLLLQKAHSNLQLPTLSLFIPLGISFYTLSAISYVTDVARGICKAEKNYARLLLFLIFFPVITEGPIERFGDLGRQLREEHPFDFTQFCFGCQLILWGLVQKVLLADRVNVYVSAIFSKSTKYSGIPVLLAILLYTFQIYMDFSGCIDIARGSAQLFGIHLTENFRRPFFACSVNEFWRRWHISLGSWFKDYIFYPVSLSKPFQTWSKYCRNHMPRYYAATMPAIFALFCVWISNGFWHGAAWKYVIYGLYYYGIMVIGMLAEPLFARFFDKVKIDRGKNSYRHLQQLRTFLFVNMGMLLFRAKDVKTACLMAGSLFQAYSFKNGFFVWICDVGGLRKPDLLLILSSILFLILYGHYKEKGGQLRMAIADTPLLLRWSIYLGCILAILMFGAYGPGYGVADFIYAQF